MRGKEIIVSVGVGLAVLAGSLVVATIVVAVGLPIALRHKYYEENAKKR